MSFNLSKFEETISSTLIKLTDSSNLMEMFDILLTYESNIHNLFDALIKTDCITMHYFGGIIKGRYNHQTNELLSEKTTLQNLLDKIDEYLEKNQGKLSSYNLKKEVKENIEIALKYIENIEIQTNKV